MSDWILLSQPVEGVRTITLNRPEQRNALTRPMMQSCADALVTAEADPETRAILLNSNGKAFCAGADLDGLAGEPLTKENDPGHQLLMNAANLKKPLVIAMQGPAVGIGATLTLNADLIYAAPQASLRTAFIDLGLPPEGGASFLLPERMGRQVAGRLLLLGETLTAAEALASGLISQIVAAEELQTTALAAAQTLARKPVRALATTRQLMTRAHLIDTMEHEQNIFRAAMHDDEFKQAIAALRTKFGLIQPSH
ncbi:MAG: enoyl-CoA hydratase-related protein [Spongiibacteraceae bacterium]